MRGSFTDSVSFSPLLVALWCSRHFHHLCGLGHGLTLAANMCARALAHTHECVRKRVYGCVHACVGRVAGCLLVFSLAEFHTAAWQQRAGQLNSLDGEKRARQRREEEERGKKRGGGTLRAWRARAHTPAHQHTLRLFACPPGTKVRLQTLEL